MLHCLCAEMAELRQRPRTAQEKEPLYKILHKRRWKYYFIVFITANYRGEGANEKIQDGDS